MSIEASSKDLTKIWAAAPQWATLVIVVVAFTVYLDRHEGREIEREKRLEKLADIRIEQCHAVQEEANRVMLELTHVLQEQTRTFDRMTIAIEQHEGARRIYRESKPQTP